MPNSIPIIEAARSYLGVPFYHAGRDRNGVDCIGLIVCVARDLGYQFKDDRNYSAKGTYLDRMLAGISQFAHEISPADRQPGDILIFDIKGMIYHCAILVPAKDGENIVHADAHGILRKTVENSLGRYAKRIHSVWRFND